MSVDRQTELLSAFRESRSRYEQFGKQIEQLLSTLLGGAGIRTDAIHCRTKSVDSLSEKLHRLGKSYATLEAVPDLVGLRVIVYHLEDVDRAVRVIQDEFEVDDEASGDAAAKLAHDEFGYLSVHLVVRLSSNRRMLTEWRSMDNFRAEIQVRTVLQHAWASISHSLQYKREADVPHVLRRRLARLSAVLELGDQEFAAIGREQHQLMAADDPQVEDALMVLRQALRNSAHSFEWIRGHTPLRYSDEQFSELIKNNPKDLRRVSIIQHDEIGNRIIPGKPGMSLIKSE